MKKILCFIDSLSSGGAQRQFVGMTAALKRAGYNVKIITYHHLPFYLSLLENEGIEYEYVSKANNKLLRIYCINRAIKTFKPNLVISYLDMPSKIACICKLLQSKKLKLIVSERNTTQILTHQERAKFFLYRYADIIVPNSYSQQRFIEENFPGLSNKVETITNFVDLDRFSPAKEHKYDKDAIRIICVGRVIPQKNVLRFLDAVNILKNKGLNFKIGWFGAKVDHNYYQNCIDKIKLFNLDNYFEFHQPNLDITPEYQQSDIFCLPSTYEGYPNVLCEAMSCGLPVVCSAVCDNPIIAEDGINGFLFNPLSVEDMSSALIKAINTTNQQRQVMGSASRRFAEEKFSYNNFSKKYEQLIQKILS